MLAVLFDMLLELVRKRRSNFAEVIKPIFLFAESFYK